jgi:hypothetical protein
MMSLPLKSIKQQKKKSKRMACFLYSEEADPVEALVEVPVFMLPHNDLFTIPEESEIYQGFYIRMSLIPHQERTYSGLMPLSNLDMRAMDRSATTRLEYRFYCRPARARAE